jgi:hypothetical protein
MPYALMATRFAVAEDGIPPRVSAISLGPIQELAQDQESIGPGVLRCKMERVIGGIDVIRSIETPRVHAGVDEAAVA